MTTRALLLIAMAGALALDTFHVATAQPFPSRPITMIVPFPAGGTSDPLARTVAEGMKLSLGQPVIVENVAGANGSIGVGRAARAPADGYTIVLGGLPTHVSNGAAYKLQYDVVRDFEPVSLLVDVPRFIVSKKAVPARNVRELVAWVKDSKGQVSAGTAGPASTSHLGGVLFESLTGTRLHYVPYRGDVLALQDVVAGHIDLMFDSAASSLPQLRADKVKVYAVMGKSRIGQAPEIPAVDEAGLPGFYMTVWLGLWTPKAVPRDIIAKLNSAVLNALADPSVRQRLAGLGMEIFPREQQTPEALGKFQKAEIEKWWPIIKAAGIKAE